MKFEFSVRPKKLTVPKPILHYDGFKLNPSGFFTSTKGDAQAASERSIIPLANISSISLLITSSILYGVWIYFASHWFFLCQIDPVFCQGRSVNMSLYSFNNNYTSLICSALNSGFIATSLTLWFFTTLFRGITTAVLFVSSFSSSNTLCVVGVGRCKNTKTESLYDDGHSFTHAIAAAWCCTCCFYSVSCHLLLPVDYTSTC